MAIDASQKSFMFYHSGVYSDSDCSSEEMLKLNKTGNGWIKSTFMPFLKSPFPFYLVITGDAGVERVLATAKVLSDILESKALILRS